MYRYYSILSAPNFCWSKNPLEAIFFPDGALFFLKFVRENNKTDIANSVGFCFSLPFSIFAALIHSHKYYCHETIYQSTRTLPRS